MYANSALVERPWQYVEQLVVDLPSERLHTNVMQRAWSDLAKAHPALRTIIVDNGAQGIEQKITPSTHVIIPEHDWETIPRPTAEARFERFLNADREAGIDATNEVPFRVTIFHFGQNHSKLVWTFPHSLLDGASFAPLLDEVFRRYQENSPGIPADVKPVPSNEHIFKSHCNALAVMSHDAGEAHFAEALQGWSGNEGLVQASVEPTRKSELSHELTESQSAALLAFAKRAGVSPTTVILAGWGTVLARISGQNDVVFGNTRNGRRLVKGAQNAAGCFITSVPVRVRLSPTLTVGQLLQNTHQEHVNAHPFEFTPPANIARRLDLPPSKPIFDTIVMCDHKTIHARLKEKNVAWADRKVELLEEGHTAVSVAVYFDTRTRIVVEYDPSQVPLGNTLNSYLVRFLNNLAKAGLDTPLGAVSMLDKAQEERLIDLSGHRQLQSHIALPCSSQFEQAAAKHPNRIALVEADGTELSFQILDQSADRMARRLAQAGVLPGDHVGICMGRGAGFITAILAIWKAGAAFVPMDPGYPSATLNIIAQDSDLRFVLVDSTAPLLEATTLDVEALPHTEAQLPDPDQRDPADTAYVIFTSGSTGRPKGVMVSHASLAAHAAAIIPHFDLKAADRVLQFAALSFDVALEEIIPTLLAGSTLVLRQDSMSESISDFLEQSNALGITVMNLPTGFWVTLTDLMHKQTKAFPPKVKLVIVGGERMPLSVLRRWRETVPNVRILNGYGPTEATITCTTFDATTRQLEEDTVPIGRPLSHAQVWVLTTDGALAPEGVPGELFISGPALAQGYIGNPDRTNRSFCRPTFEPAVVRTYHTGDRAVWRDGLLHFLGRSDRQIKLRGYRIEPGQIEAALESQGAIDRAHVALHKTSFGQLQLVAWYSAPKDHVAPSPDAVKELAAKLLPPQMRPQPMPVASWPKTPGGKIDTARLPSPEPLPAGNSSEEVEHTELSQKVAEIFGGILNVADIGPTTSFFDAGGDSLSLLRLMPEIEKVFGQKLKPTDIYSDPTPRGVLSALNSGEADPLVVIPIQPKGALPPLYAVHVLGDNGSFFRPLAAELGPNQPLFGLTVGHISEDTPTTIEDIAAFYLHQITRHHPTGPLALIAVSSGSYATMELAQQLLAAGRDVFALILLDAEGPGGRARVSWPKRILAHIQNLRSFGWPYIKKIRAGRIRERKLKIATARLQKRANDKDSVTAQDILNVADFVAANKCAIEAYHIQPYPRRLTIYRAGHDRFDSPDAIRSGLGWSSVAAGGFDILDVPGDHLGILQAPYVKVLGQNIARRLASR